MSSKLAIAHAFSKAAHSYDSMSGLQRETGQHLLSKVAKHANKQHEVGLDLGCGTGFFATDLSQHCQQLIGLDLALGMLQYAKTQRPTVRHWLQGDAEHLPLANNSLDWVFSSLALQWCDDLSVALAEVHRVLKPGGKLFFSTLAGKSLWQLQHAWRQVDDLQHVNEFKTEAELARICQNSPFMSVTSQVREQVVQYRHPFQLLKELKGIGANHVLGNKPSGLAGKGKFNALHLAYQEFNQDGHYPASYFVFYGELQK
ncbi:malonyl-ACP O-methyltransferase BioC [Motilimonas pumila]|uniref:Malonyl-[acyl-carrier protein] O-methyltransferase n=1 Tax=Motilimonas pumila TaxID=2303987 RepID=A0A418YG27_9GAMM|nr:malonyl-ACP O-methyltransferase BioC [Motilimonas pumila]RJG48456.1 malonyl-[acyl-carrier protein] O-methyltransferase BioC [Motilimonas pumila]